MGNRAYTGTTSNRVRLRFRVLAVMLAAALLLQGTGSCIYAGDPEQIEPDAVLLEETSDSDFPDEISEDVFSGMEPEFGPAYDMLQNDGASVAGDASEMAYDTNQTQMNTDQGQVYTNSDQLLTDQEELLVGSDMQAEQPETADQPETAEQSEAERQAALSQQEETAEQVSQLPEREEAPDQAEQMTLPEQEEAKDQAEQMTLPEQEEAPDQAEQMTLPEQEEAPDQAEQMILSGQEEAGMDEEGLIEDPALDSAAEDSAAEDIDAQALLSNLPAVMDLTALGEPEILTDTWVNPAYEDVLEPEDIIPDQAVLDENEAAALVTAQETVHALDEALLEELSQVAAQEEERGVTEGAAGTCLEELNTVLSAEEENGTDASQPADMQPDETAGIVSGDAGTAVTGQTQAVSEEWLEAALDTVSFEPKTKMAEQGYYMMTQTEAIAAEIKTNLKNRVDEFSIGMAGDEGAENALSAAKEALFKAMAHTGVPTEGDYLLYQLGGSYNAVYKFDYNGEYFYIVNFKMHYYTDAAQESEMDAEVASLLPALQDAGSTYDRVLAVYEYLASTVDYGGSYYTMFTGYGALVNHVAVCQGYAVAMYRLLLEMGIDCRVIGGQSSDGEEHAWNIIRLGSVYYNADVTWDAGETEYLWFLKAESSSGFDLYHIRDSEYLAADFTGAYPMSSTDYAVPEDSGSDSSGTDSSGTDSGSGGSSSSSEALQMECPVNGTHVPVVTEAVAATCTSTGMTAGTVCAACGEVLTGQAILPPSGHSYTGWSLVSAATISSPGAYIRRCVRCGDTQYRYSNRATPFITLNINKSVITMKKGKTKKLAVSFANGDRVVKYKSSRPKVVSVSKTGKLKAKKKGKATITVTLASGLKASFRVKVTAKSKSK